MVAADDRDEPDADSDMDLVESSEVILERTMLAILQNIRETEDTNVGIVPPPVEVAAVLTSSVVFGGLVTIEDVGFP